ncbi:hypothetical protein ACHAW5_008525 [Stephanodiscus triporus]|uniref:Uncharacterized protein n=1 Tax=Stephanodiscus triporus TaxID=2934178 RepID=A0ABD3NE46_9STRA
MVSSRIVPRGFQPHARRWLGSHGKDREPILDSSDKVSSAVNRILERNNSLFKKPGRAFGIFSGASNDLQELFLKCGGRSVVNDGEEISFVFKKPGRTLGISSDLQELFETFGGRYVVEDGAECYVKQIPPIIGWSQNSSYFKERQAKNALDPSVITGDQLRTVLDIKLVPLFQSEWKYNARQVEDELKRRFLHLEFGTRLFRKPAVAAWRAPPDGMIHKVGMAFSDKIPELVEKGEIVLRET